MKVLIASLFFFGSFGAMAADLRPFKTDGCTGYRDGTRKRPGVWRHCCVDHDLAFWAGGTPADRVEADRELRDCVAATGETHQADVIYMGVRIGAISPWKIPGMQFGNAWAPRATRKTPLTSEEIYRLETEILHNVYDPVAPIAQRQAFVRRLRGRPAP
jgi:hypothetical protein